MSQVALLNHGWTRMHRKRLAGKYGAGKLGVGTGWVIRRFTQMNADRESSSLRTAGDASYQLAGFCLFFLTSSCLNRFSPKPRLHKSAILCVHLRIKSPFSFPARNVYLQFPNIRVHSCPFVVPFKIGIAPGQDVPLAAESRNA